jgi:hypothetical protein
MHAGQWMHNMCIIAKSKPFYRLLKYIVLPDWVAILYKYRRAYTKRKELIVSIYMDKHILMNAPATYKKPTKCNIKTQPEPK